MQIPETEAAIPRRRVLLREGLVFAVLCVVAAALFGVTLVLFRSFQDHREALGREWSERGHHALQANRPEDAVAALRVALSYQPSDRGDQFALAQALAASGHRDEAANYFLTLWEQRPGEGITNLQLARLARERGDAPAAIRYYRASIFGSWEGDGVLRRREARLELADYFKQQGDEVEARQELLIAAGNAPPEEYLEVSLGDRLEGIGDPQDALALYTKALQQDPHRRSALIKAARAAFQLNDYPNAARLLVTALREPATPAAPASGDAELREMLEIARRIPELNLSRDLPAEERAAHLVEAESIARRRLQSCTAEVNARLQRTGENAAEDIAAVAMNGLQRSWKQAGSMWTRSALAKNAALSDEATKLIGDTEGQTAMVCGAPSGDDALLLKLAAQQGEPEPVGTRP